MDESISLVDDEGEKEGKIEKLDFVTSPPNNFVNQEKFPKSVGFIVGNEFCERYSVHTENKQSYNDFT